MAAPLSILCIASYHKGHAFLREAKRQGARVFLVTSESLRDAEWPRESLDDMFYVRDEAHRWKLDDLILGASHLARRVPIDRVVPLDDFDLEKASALREHLRVPGMGESTTRYFRDKLAMRLRADEAGVRVPPFVHVLNEAKVRAFCAKVPPPWVLKPRLEAGTIGIKKVQNEAELWPLVDGLGDRASFHLLEHFVAGSVYHVDSIVYEREVLVADAVGLALLVVLDRLAPTERLAFVLHDMFDVPFEEIADIVGRTPTAARQLASRARRRVQNGSPVPDPDLARQREVVDAFFAAAHRGDFDALVAVLDPDVVLRSDGGSARAGASMTVRGASAVARRALMFAKLSPFVRPVLVNGVAGVVVAPHGRLFSIMGFTVTGGRIVAIDALSDPARLGRLEVALGD